MQADLDQQLADGTIDARTHKSRTAIVAFAAERGVVPARGEVDLWGFGTVEVAFADPAGGGWWTYLDRLTEPLGMTEAELKELFEEEREEDEEDPRVDVILWTDREAGAAYAIDVVSDQFAFMALGTASPWARTFIKNMFPTLRRAAVGSGLAAAMGLSALMSDRALPSEDVARAQALSGPTGPIERGEL